MGDQLLQTCGESGNYEMAKELIMKHNANVEFVDRSATPLPPARARSSELSRRVVLAEGKTAFTFCEEKMKRDIHEGIPPRCDPDKWVQLVEMCVEAREKGEKDMELGAGFGMGGGGPNSQGGVDADADDEDTPKKRQERLVAYEKERAAKASLSNEGAHTFTHFYSTFIPCFFSLSPPEQISSLDLQGIL